MKFVCLHDLMALGFWGYIAPAGKQGERGYASYIIVLSLPRAHHARRDSNRGTEWT